MSGNADTPPHVLHVCIGDSDVGPWTAQVKIDVAVHQSNRAVVLLKTEAVDKCVVDYFAPIEIAVTYDGQRYSRFTGAIEFVTVLPGIIKLECEGMPLVRGKVTYPFAREKVTAPELIWTLGRLAGYPESRLHISGVETIEPEDIEVAVPIHEIKLDCDLRVGNVLVTHYESVQWATENWPEEATAPVKFFAHARSYAVMTFRQIMLLDAEREGLRAAGIVVAWLVARMRSGIARLPDGKLQQFDKTTAIVAPRIGDTVAVRGLSSGRRWLRVPQIGQETGGALVPVSTIAPFTPDVGGQLTVADSEAYLAFDRSVRSADPLAAVITLWDAINFYAAGTAVEPLFSKEDIKSIKASIPETLTPPQKQALLQKLGGVNDPPLMQRLKLALERDGLTLTDGEFAVLKRLRAIRNPAQHGTTAPTPTEEDLALAWSIVGRMLITRSRALQTGSSRRYDRPRPEAAESNSA